ncbi:Pyruvate-flavodoxin oxidoreductase [Planctomycetes bacterium Pan216]|uniref:Pyruvate-flavodoxin oxidoreductase n=1 Tax=Kolteria novifilia TaxID=2527975 RepID=A0A518AYC8_9BACT|nr:Pyruvate-flavodoxin oxidoreductase [Planctomycetes bacterium Pan216]
MAKFVTLDGNEAAARIAHLTNEVIAIYPITPASPMGELCDAWSAVGRKNVLGTVPSVIEMQHEGGAAGAVHGSLQAGAMTTTFTASQGLLLMLPNMFKIAGELTPTVFHIAARSIATHALSIFGDHSDVMAARTTGWAMLASSSVQEAQDLALVAHIATLESRVPFLHFFDGFRTSHEVNKIEQVPETDIEQMLRPDLIEAFRHRCLTPDRPILRGTAQNPDVFFQAREACNLYHDAVPATVTGVMAEFEKRTGRSYHLFGYTGAPDATTVIVMMGSGAGAVEDAVRHLTSQGRKVGLLTVRLYRPFSVMDFLEALPKTAESIAVLDRTKEPGAVGEPLYTDVVGALVEGWREQGGETLPRVIGGRYGLSSKEFTPPMAAAIFDELEEPNPKRHFTIGINDDVTHLSLAWDPDGLHEPKENYRAVFYGLGSDGTVGACKNTVKIIGEHTDLFTQGYFVYDSKKSGSMTVSHLRFSPEPIRSSYLVRHASFVACHQAQFLDRHDMLELAEPGATFLLNTTHGPDEVWETLPVEVQQAIIDKDLRFYVVDAYAVAESAQLGRRINTVMQTCFFGLAGVIPTEEAVAAIKEAIHKTYGKRGESVVERNCQAVDQALASLHAVEVPSETRGGRHQIPPVPTDAPDFVRRVTAMMIAGKGDLLPVSALPVDGTFPTGTAQFEKRRIALQIPIWDPDICIECGLCSLMCPHAAIRSKAFDTAQLQWAPPGYRARQAKAKELEGLSMTIQVAPEDCTGCGVCVDVCPAKSKEVAKHKAINLEAIDDHLDVERANYDYFLGLPEFDRREIPRESVRGSQLLEPLFEYSGACAGCGETPYVKLVSQLFGDRMLVANATGCSSIYGGNLPTTPWSVNSEGRGPAWSNSLFEDNAEFGLGMRLALDQQRSQAAYLLEQLADVLPGDAVQELLAGGDGSEQWLLSQRERVANLRKALAGVDRPAVKELLAIADVLVPRSVWIIGGDGWAYDIGFSGLDHTIASGRNVNILVLDTEVYSNTGGQASKATPRAAVAKFAAGGKAVGKKDLGMIAMAYGNAYVGQIAIGGNPRHAVKTLLEAESYPGPSLVMAYSNCIAHGINMETSMTHQKDAVTSGYWPLYHYDPRHAKVGDHPFVLDSRKPTTRFADYAAKEGRFAMLARANPESAARLMELAQADISERWRWYEQMAGVERTIPQASNENGNGKGQGESS